MSPLKTRRFFVDLTVQRLGKWLRYLGIDAPFIQGSKSAPSEGYLLTKKRPKKHNPSERILFVPHDRIEDQLIWFAKKFPDVIESQKTGSRCIRCNRCLIDIPREEAQDQVPDYIYQTHTHFKMCPNCRRIYWKGSHLGRMQIFLESINFPREGIHDPHHGRQI